MKVMLDIETLGKAPGCAILTIGAVCFSEFGLGATFYTAVSVESCVKRDLTIDPDTLAWWMKQSDEARQAAFNDKTKTLPVALMAFHEWFMTNDGEQVWCHGASFDTPILEAACRACGLPVPWKFWNIRDTRTLYELASVHPDRNQGTHHNALDDAISQAHAAIRAMQVLKRGLQTRAALSSDAFAASFQSLSQYRNALINYVDSDRTQGGAHE